MSSSERLFPEWITEPLAEQAERSADNIERRHGPNASSDELREIAAAMRGNPDADGSGE